jgi:hypothetical protein
VSPFWSLVEVCAGKEKGRSAPGGGGGCFDADGFVVFAWASAKTAAGPDKTAPATASDTKNANRLDMMWSYFFAGAAAGG